MVLRETLLFSADATVVATLYGSGNSINNGGNGSSSGGSNDGSGSRNGGGNSGGFSYVYCDDDASVTMTDDGQGLLVDIHNNNHNHNNNNNNNKSLSSSNVSPQLRSAMEKKLLLLVACALVIPGQPPYLPPQSIYTPYIVHQLSFYVYHIYSFVFSYHITTSFSSISPYSCYPFILMFFHAIRVLSPLWFR